MKRKLPYGRNCNLDLRWKRSGGWVRVGGGWTGEGLGYGFGVGRGMGGLEGGVVMGWKEIGVWERRTEKRWRKGRGRFWGGEGEWVKGDGFGEGMKERKGSEGFENLRCWGGRVHGLGRRGGYGVLGYGEEGERLERERKLKRRKRGKGN
ncbi:uncharacterized protein G2W53_001412 [Senna tora]|uniref:Uncharacterized protein n=1 Tax=Senna tora TaxID=362788 RepID=A0A834XHV6_9FABA|nr:uncharacterized protein G2W53_001412 [Senna tora]